MSKIIDPSFCGWDTASLFIFSQNVFGDFIYYSHILPALSAVMLGFFIFLSNRNDIVSRLLFSITIVFALWSLFDLILWANEKTHFIMFFWSILIHFELLIYVLSFYFVYAFLCKKMPHWYIDLVTFLIFIPAALFGHTKLNLIAFDYTNCEREALEGSLWHYYVYNVEFLISFGILLFGTYVIYKSKQSERKPKIYVVAGVLVFLMMFSAGNIAGSFNLDWSLAQYGLFGMAILVAILGYIVVTFNAFKTTMLTTELLIAALALMNLSLLFLPKINNVRVIAAITFFLTVVVGLLLIRSNRRDLRQKVQIETLALGLEKANDQLKVLDKMKSEFVSIASHQLRSPLTAIRGYSSMLLEGSFGPLPAKAKEAIDHINEASRFMASSVEDYLTCRASKQAT